MATHNCYLHYSSAGLEGAYNAKIICLEIKLILISGRELFIAEHRHYEPCPDFDSFYTMTRPLLT